jgi:hypothetical protein
MPYDWGECFDYISSVRNGSVPFYKLGDSVIDNATINGFVYPMTSPVPGLLVNSDFRREDYFAITREGFYSIPFLFLVLLEGSSWTASHI